MSKFFISYRYDRIKNELVNIVKDDNVIQEQKEVQFTSYSSDVFEFDRELKSLEDIQALEKMIWDKLEPEVKLRDQKLVNLLVLGIYKLRE